MRCGELTAVCTGLSKMGAIVVNTSHLYRQSSLATRFGSFIQSRRKSKRFSLFVNASNRKNYCDAQAYTAALIRAGTVPRPQEATLQIFLLPDEGVRLAARPAERVWRSLH